MGKTNMSNCYAVRHMLRYRGSEKKFSILDALKFELKHPKIEKAAEWRLRTEPDDKIEISYSLWTGCALVFSGDKIKRKYEGDVWSIPCPKDRNRLIKTRVDPVLNKIGLSRGYNECSVAGKPYGVLVENQSSITKSLRRFCKDYNLKIFTLQNRDFDLKNVY